jgi:inositol hexakisphosphate/diphosphoinositol-pentakisphosphate kinase
LLECKIPVAHHVFVSRDGFGGAKAEPSLVEHDEYIEVDGTPTQPAPTQAQRKASERVASECVAGVRISKPFVEKPADAENHDVYIYFHPNTGGGVQATANDATRRNVPCAVPTLHCAATH